MVLDYADMVQIGARNMQNFPLLTAVGKIRKPVLLKRNPSATVEVWLQAAEYILSEGNNQVVLCERGVCSSGAVGGYHFDLETVLRLRHLTHLPVVVDPSHGTRTRHHVIPMALAGLVIGADGIMVEVHPNPERALSDGPQSLDLAGLSTLMEAITRLPSAALSV
jgi:3-deoxy-7-phosphoheptulonate synthase